MPSRLFAFARTCGGRSGGRSRGRRWCGRSRGRSGGIGRSSRCWCGSLGAFFRLRWLFASVPKVSYVPAGALERKTRSGNLLEILGAATLWAGSDGRISELLHVVVGVTAVGAGIFVNGHGAKVSSVTHVPRWPNACAKCAKPLIIRGAALVFVRCDIRIFRPAGLPAAGLFSDACDQLRARGGD